MYKYWWEKTKKHSYLKKKTLIWNLEQGILGMSIYDDSLYIICSFSLPRTVYYYKITCNVQYSLIKLIHSFLTLGSEGRQCKDCNSTTWHLLYSEHLYHLGFFVDLRLPLVIYTTCINRWAGLHRQRCRSRRWSSFAEWLRWCIL